MNFTESINLTEKDFAKYAQVVHPPKWQSIDVSKKPEAEMREILNVYLSIECPSTVEELQQQIKPNLPWADDHFIQERVSGLPLNPGETWKTWPWGLSADKFRTEGEQFSHTYAERYWPKQAGLFPGGKPPLSIPALINGIRGIRYKYGDLWDVVNLLRREPLTRQAYLPVWFPEDTGVSHGERVPCSLGYHWLLRGTSLHTAYYIRSCDIVRHFRDDLYLTARLTLWMIDQLRTADPLWRLVKPGSFNFHCVSMHSFVNDWRKLCKELGVTQS